MFIVVAICHSHLQYCWSFKRSTQSVFGIMFSHLGIAIIHDSPERHPRGGKFWSGFAFTVLIARGLLILRKIIKIVATRCHIFRQKCTKFDFGWDSAPDPAGGGYSAPPDPGMDSNRNGPEHRSG